MDLVDGVDVPMAMSDVRLSSQLRSIRKTNNRHIGGNHARHHRNVAYQTMTPEGQNVEYAVILSGPGVSKSNVTAIKNAVSGRRSSSHEIANMVFSSGLGSRA